VDDPAENGATTHRPMSLATCLGDRNVLIEALMGARRVEERHVFTHDSSKMGFMDDPQPVQAFFPH
jgi:hypothetical protein